MFEFNVPALYRMCDIVKPLEQKRSSSHKHTHTNSWDCSNSDCYWEYLEQRQHDNKKQIIHWKLKRRSKREKEKSKCEKEGKFCTCRRCRQHFQRKFWMIQGISSCDTYENHKIIIPKLKKKCLRYFVLFKGHTRMASNNDKHNAKQKKNRWKFCYVVKSKQHIS